MTTFVQDGEILLINLVDQRLDAVRAPAFKQALIDNIRNQPKRVMIDASKVDFIDSTGLGALVTLLKMMGKGGRIVVAGAKPPVRRLFEITKLDSVFSLVADPEAAAVALNA